jgi:predicted TIM-barrel fold metal-dependent hydrolase
MLLFATDYPHRHPAGPLETFLRQLPEPLAQKIRHENARALYGLPAPATSVH